MPKAKPPLQVADCATCDLQTACLERNPAQRAFAAAPLQAPLPTGFSLRYILSADFADGVAVESQLDRGTSRQGDQVKGRQEPLVTTQSKQTDFLTEIPHRIDRPRHPLEMCAARGVFDPVLIREYGHYFTPSLLVFSQITNSRIALWLGLGRLNRPISLDRFLDLSDLVQIQ